MDRRWDKSISSEKAVATVELLDALFTRRIVGGDTIQAALAYRLRVADLTLSEKRFGQAKVGGAITKFEADALVKMRNGVGCSQL